MPIVSVIIPVLNRAQDISRCLDSLLKLNFPKDDYEIIVVDNNSIDNTKEVIQRYPVRYVFEPQRGRGPARNKGVQESKGKYLAFIDSDCIADPNWLKELVKALDENPHIAAFGGKVTPLKTDRLVEEYLVIHGRLQQELALLSAELGQGLPRLITANAIVRKDILEITGSFDRDFITHEDTDLSWRLVLNGYQIGYASQAMVFHRHITTLFRFFLHQFEFGRAFYAIHKKYNGILFLYLSSKVNFLLTNCWRLLVLPFLFFKVKKRYQEKSNTLALLFVVNSLIVTSAELLAFVSEVLHLIKPISPVLNLDRDMVLHKNLRINQDGFFLHPSPGVIWFFSDDLIRFLNIKDRTFYKLNETSTRIWQILCETQDFSQAVKIISQEYRIPEETISRDTAELLGQLEKEKLIFKNVR